jgi:hypothetical protein
MAWSEAESARRRFVYCTYLPNQTTIHWNGAGYDIRCAIDALTAGRCICHGHLSEPIDVVKMRRGETCKCHIWPPTFCSRRWFPAEAYRLPSQEQKSNVVLISLTQLVDSSCPLLFSFHSSPRLALTAHSAPTSARRPPTLLTWHYIFLRSKQLL